MSTLPPGPSRDQLGRPVDAYGRPLDPYGHPLPPAGYHVAPRRPTPPGSPATGLWALALAVLGTLASLAGVVWLSAEADRAIALGDRAGADHFLDSFLGGFALVEILAGLALLAGLVIGIVATATNRGRGWGIGAIVGFVAGPVVSYGLALVLVIARLGEWAMTDPAFGA